NRLAHRLRALGVEPGTIVALALPRSIDLVVAVLGILKAGGAYLPLDAAYPTERLQLMVEDATPVAFVGTAASLVGLGDALVAPAIALDVDVGPSPPSSPDAPPAGGATGESLAAVLYTSGSTGRPKGVMLS